MGLQLTKHHFFFLLKWADWRTRLHRNSQCSSLRATPWWFEQRTQPPHSSWIGTNYFALWKIASRIAQSVAGNWQTRICILIGRRHIFAHFVISVGWRQAGLRRVQAVAVEQLIFWELMNLDWGREVTGFRRASLGTRSINWRIREFFLSL